MPRKSDESESTIYNHSTEETARISDNAGNKLKEERARAGGVTNSGKKSLSHGHVRSSPLTFGNSTDRDCLLGVVHFTTKNTNQF